LLAKIAVEDKHWSVRKRAVGGLTDQTVLTKVAVEDHDSDVRKAAVEKLTDQTMAAKIAVADGVPGVRKAAVERLTDGTVLAKLAMEDHDSGVRKAAVERLTDQTALAKLTMEDHDSEVRKAALERLTDQTVLAKVAMEDHDSDVRKAAVERLTDQTVVAKIAVADAVPGVRKAAVERLTDETVLAKIVTDDKDYNVRIAAIERLIARGNASTAATYGGITTEFWTLVAQGASVDELLFVAAANRQMEMVMLLKAYTHTPSNTDTANWGQIAASCEEQSRLYVQSQLSGGVIARFVVLSEHQWMEVHNNKYGEAEDIDIVNSLNFIAKLTKGGENEVVLGKCQDSAMTQIARARGFPSPQLSGTPSQFTMCPPSADADCLNLKPR